MTIPQRIALTLILLINTATSCSIGSEPNNKFLQLQFTKQSAHFQQGETIGIKLSSNGTDDSLNYHIDQNSEQSTAYSDTLQIPSTGLAIGKHTLSVRTGSCSSLVSFTILPIKAPATINYKIIKTYPHSINSYTQGLVYDAGALYESTGMYGQSKLLLTEIATGKAKRSIDLDRQYFGEGLAMNGNLLYQLTWQSHKGFVYSKNDFTLVKTFEYPTEGWGLAFNGKDLILSDGSNILYYIDTTSLKVVKQITVLDNHGPVTRLNELEWVDSCVYANVYQTDRIVKIDERTGAVIGQMECKNLLTEQDKHPEIDVLNGIAKNPVTGNYYITGKNWPKLFEIELIEEQQ